MQIAGWRAKGLGIFRWLFLAVWRMLRWSFLNVRRSLRRLPKALLGAVLATILVLGGLLFGLWVALGFLITGRPTTEYVMPTSAPSHSPATTASCCGS